MCGLAFSGKSTLARKIAEHTGSKLVSFDTIWVKKDKEQLVPKGAEGWRYIRDVAQEEILAYLKAGDSVVYDDNNPRKEHREELRKVAKAGGVHAAVIYLDTPLDIIREREAVNRASQDRNDVEPENFEKVMKDMEIPTAEEHVITFTPKTNFDDFLEDLN